MKLIYDTLKELYSNLEFIQKTIPNMIGINLGYDIHAKEYQLPPPIVCRHDWLTSYDKSGLFRLAQLAHNFTYDEFCKRVELLLEYECLKTLRIEESGANAKFIKSFKTSDFGFGEIIKHLERRKRLHIRYEADNAFNLRQIAMTSDPMGFLRECQEEILALICRYIFEPSLPYVNIYDKPNLDLRLYYLNLSESITYKLIEKIKLCERELRRLLEAHMHKYGKEFDYKR